MLYSLYMLIWVIFSYNMSNQEAYGRIITYITQSIYRSGTWRIRFFCLVFCFFSNGHI